MFDAHCGCDFALRHTGLFAGSEQNIEQFVVWANAIVFGPKPRVFAYYTKK